MSLSIAAWAGRFLPKVAPAETLSADQGEVIVQETGESDFSQAIAAGPHPLRADEPTAVGGADLGPSPYGLLLASLGACTSMTLRMYAKRKGLALDRVTVRLRHEKIHARDCAECETTEGRIDHIEKEIQLEGALDDGQRQKLLSIAERCPVNRTLQSEVSILSRLV